MAEAKDSYLNMERILSATIASGADAIHPGFGFLSENSKFAALCEKCNIAFIGPSARTIVATGNKSEARNAMVRAGVPVIPGTKEPIFTAEAGRKFADEIGYMQETCGQIPFGGEVLSGQNPAAKEMLRALCDLRVSYLNSIHEEQVLNRWKQMEYGEWGSFYQYIGAHLGYRFVAGSAVFYTDRIEVEIANTGFSNICDKTELALVRENEDGTEEVYQADYDLRMLAGQETVKIVFLLSGLLDEKKDRYFLYLTRCRGNVAIRFANEGGEER